MSRTEVTAVIDSIRSQLNSTFRTEWAQLVDGIGPTDTSIQLQHTTAALRPGAVLCIGLERMRVTEVVPANNSATVRRAWNTHLPATPHAAGADVWLNPRFDAVEIFDAMYDEIASYDVDLFRIDDFVVPVAGDAEVVQIPAGFENLLGVINVRRNYNLASSQAWPTIDYRVIRGHALPDAGASGVTIRLLERTEPGEVHVLVGMPFALDELQPGQDLVDDVGLEPSMVDVVKLGVRYRVLGDNEAARSGRMTQDEPRRTEEVPPAAAANEAMRMYALYIRRKNTEIMRFRSKYPLSRA